MKALERREKIEQLKRELESKEKLLIEINNCNRELKVDLATANKKINDLDKLMQNLKKKSK